MKDMETRTFPMELRLSGDDDTPVLEGHIAVFNQLSEDLGGFKEKISPGAFAETIEKHDIRALWNHNSDHVLGRLSADTLSLKEDKTGLAFRNEPPNTSWFKDGMESLKRKDVSGASFGFWTDDDEWSTEKDGAKIRTLKKVTLVEVSPGVTFPAYPQANVTIAVRSMQAWEKAEEAREKEEAGQRDQAVVQIETRKRRLRLMELASH